MSDRAMHMQTFPDPPVSQSLNSRQKDVLFFICKGLRNSEIGTQLGLSERTVKYYVNQLLLMFDATNRTELVGRLAEDRWQLVTTSDRGLHSV